MDSHLLPDVMVFFEVARCGSLTRAAARLNTVQSNVSARIKKLENSLGVSLLKRHARGVKITPAGEAVLSMALRVDSILEDLRFTFGRGSGREAAKLRIGAIETVLAARLPRVMAGFLGRFPTVEISIQAGSSASILNQIRDGDLDLGFVSRVSRNPNLRENHAFADELVLVAPPGVRSIAFLRTEAGSALNILVQRLGCSYTERLLGVLAEKAPRPYRQLEMGTLEGILGFVELGLGIAAMPREFIRSLSVKRKLSLLELPARIRKLDTYLVAPVASQARAVVNEFVQFLEEPLKKST